MSTCPDKVRAITGSTLEDTEIQPFIDAADCILLQISEYTITLTDACNTQITTYLAAHLLTITNVGTDSTVVAKESLRGKYSVEYLVPKGSGRGILGTPHGQTANMMTGGRLAELDKTPVSFNSIGSL